MSTRYAVDSLGHSHTLTTQATEDEYRKIDKDNTLNRETISVFDPEDNSRLLRTIYNQYDDSGKCIWTKYDFNFSEGIDRAEYYDYNSDGKLIGTYNDINADGIIDEYKSEKGLFNGIKNIFKTMFPDFSANLNQIGD